MTRVAFFRKALVAAVLAAPMAAPLSAQAAELVMFDSEGCYYCDKWRREIGHIYPKTEEGAVAPVRIVDLHGKRPEDLKHVKGVSFTPTFVLVHDGEEIDRLVGYPGDNFFWPLLADMLGKLPKEALKLPDPAQEPEG